MNYWIIILCYGLLWCIQVDIQTVVNLWVVLVCCITQHHYILWTCCCPLPQYPPRTPLTRKASHQMEGEINTQTGR